MVKKEGTDLGNASVDIHSRNLVEEFTGRRAFVCRNIYGKVSVSLWQRNAMLTYYLGVNLADNWQKGGGVLPKLVSEF